MASKKIRAAIEGSIASPTAAKAVINSLDKTTAQGTLATKNTAAAVADIPTPGSATASDCATKINALLASLRAAGVIA